MKKTLLILALSLFMVTPTLANETTTSNSKFAKVDVLKVMDNYKKNKDAEKWYKSKEKELENFVIKARRDIATAKDVERARLEQKLENDFQKKIKDVNTQKTQKAKEITNDIENAAKKIAERMHYDMVITSNFVLYGAEDITNKVIEELKKSK